MSQQARTVFNIEEQKAKDVLAAIKVVQPVISLIREWGNITKEYTQLKENNAKLSEEITSIRKVIALTCTGLMLQNDLCQIVDKKSSEYEESKEKEEELKDIYDNMEKEIITYREYADLFNWIDQNIVEKVVKLNNFEDQEEFLSMIFLFLNANVRKYYLKPLNCFVGRKGFSAIHNDWDWMLEKLIANEI